MDAGPVVVGVVAVAFWGYCLWDFTHTDERDMRTFTRPVWVVVLVLGSTLGALLWFFAGRPLPPRR
ncbi:PLDc N-terminal domain-containing protein [Oryzihumus sp.]|uniref:PLDc N-terminal domain-containing protein n=1 Tax=Oryzihumus sp. TaxID=1968903 RepID=UPI002ED8B4DB